MSSDHRVNRMMIRTFFRMTARFSSRTKERLPQGWLSKVQQTLPGQQVYVPGVGLLCSVDTKDRAEAFALKALALRLSDGWEKYGGGIEEVWVFEVAEALQFRKVHDDENTQPATGTLLNHVFELSKGVQPREDWTDEDRAEAEAQAAEVERRRLAEAEIDRQRRTRYQTALTAFQQSQTSAYAESGSDLTFWQWLAGQPTFPGYSDWVDANEEVRLLPAPGATAQLTEAPAEVPEATVARVPAPSDRDLGAEIIAILDEVGDVPFTDLPQELKLPEEDVRAALARLVERGSVVEVSEGTFGLAGGADA